MPFLQTVTDNNKNKTKHASHDKVKLDPRITHKPQTTHAAPFPRRCNLFKGKIPLPGSVKRVSQCISFPVTGSMTVEASIGIPLFLFCMINVLSLILMFHTFAANLETLHQQGRQLGVYAYAVDRAVDGNEDMIKLVRAERVKPIVPILGYPGANIVSCCYMHAWTGFDVEHLADSGDGEVMVYITENGTVYHLNRSCTHLTLSIQMAGKEQVSSLRNENGAKYYACEKCGGDGELLYITQEGNRYHGTVSCSGLKRSVSCVPLSEAGGRPPCSRCGG